MKGVTPVGFFSSLSDVAACEIVWQQNCKQVLLADGWLDRSRARYWYWRSARPQEDG
ncbi:hypothetical protein [Andreprevotia sp. IGB-42]|uniref:hypothetical protein n=1 Tax=Andreprevotia sp. IGB-42 TaxID=2497473 RepID=UPI0013569586|nr:hypothetical protein [Andreprevotia sp. IGB-42]